MTKILLKASHIKKAFDGNEVLKDVNLELVEGQVVLLQGENGSGKTTLISILTGNLEPDRGRITLATTPDVQHFKFPRPWWRQFLAFTYFSPERFAQEGLARMWQDVRLFSSQTLKDNIVVATPDQAGENPIKALALFRKIAKQEKAHTHDAKQTLKNFGLEGRENSSGNRVSLGQSKRVAIARAIKSGAKVLFLDEPLAGLDNDGVLQMVDFLKNLVQEQKTSVVIVEHAFNIPKILGLVDGVLTLKDGHITYETKQEAFKEQKARHEDAMMQWLTDFAGKQGQVEKMDLPNGARLTIAHKDPSATPIFGVDNLTVSRGHRAVIATPLSFTVNQGDIALLEAPNGWGKSTLMDAIMGIIPVKTGSVILKGEHLARKPIWTRAQKGLLLSRSGDTLFPNATVDENEALYRCKTTELPRRKGRKTGSLSGGEGRRLSLSMALSQTQSDIVLLDEPFQAMDTEQEAAARLHIAQATPGKTFLITIPKLFE